MPMSVVGQAIHKSADPHTTNKGRSRLFSIPVVELTQRSAAVIRGAKWNFLSVWLLRSGKSHSSTIRERKDPTMTERRSFGI